MLGAVRFVELLSKVNYGFFPIHIGLLPRPSAAVLSTMRLLLAALWWRVASSSLCARFNYVDLRIDLYGGNIRDEDAFSDSDAYCFLSVANQTQVSAVVLETEQPTFEEFFLFGCQAIGSTVALTCYDWDPDYLVWNEDELVFRASTFHWPDRGVVERWYDATDAQYWVDVDFSYDVPAPSGAPTTAAPSLPPTTARPTAADAEDEDEAEGEYPDEAEADGGGGDDDASDAGATVAFVVVAALLLGGVAGGTGIAYRLRQKTDGVARRLLFPCFPV